MLLSRSLIYWGGIVSFGSITLLWSFSQNQSFLWASIIAIISSWSIISFSPPFRLVKFVNRIWWFLSIYHQCLGLFTYYVSQKQGFLHPPSPSTLLYPVSLLIGGWDWVQGGDPLYAAVKCLSDRRGQIWRIFFNFFAPSNGPFFRCTNTFPELRGPSQNWGAGLWEDPRRCCYCCW